MLITVRVKVSRNRASQRPQGGLRRRGSSDPEEAVILSLALLPLIKHKLFAQALPFVRYGNRELTLSEHS